MRRQDRSDAARRSRGPRSPPRLPGSSTPPGDGDIGDAARRPQRPWCPRARTPSRRRSPATGGSSSPRRSRHAPYRRPRPGSERSLAGSPSSDSGRVGPRRYHRSVSIYLDHASTTPLRREALEAMLPYLSEHWGNPSSIHHSGRRARQGLDEARESVAMLLGAKPREIVFTSGGTESDNLAISGVAWAASARGRHIVTTAIEHKAVLQECALLGRHGFDVTYVGVDGDGLVDPEAVAAAINERTVLVSVMAAN